MTEIILSSYISKISKAYDSLDIDELKRFLQYKVIFHQTQKPLSATDYVLIKYCLDNGVSTYETNGDMFSTAYKEGREDTIKFFTDNQLKIKINREEAFKVAFEQNRKDIISRLINTLYEKSYMGENLWLLAHYCILTNHLDIFKLIGAVYSEYLIFAIIHDRIEFVKYMHEERKLAIKPKHEEVAEQLGYKHLTEYFITRLDSGSIFQACEEYNTKEVKRILTLRPDLISFSELVVTKLIVLDYKLECIKCLDLPVTMEHMKIAIIKGRLDIVKYLHQDRGIKLNDTLLIYCNNRTSHDVYEYLMLKGWNK